MFRCECFLVIFSVISPILCSNEVPLLLWSSDRSTSLPQVSSLQTVTAPEFKSGFLEKLDNQNPLIVFLQDLLSVEDFSIYGNAYGAKDQNSFENVANLVSSSPSVLLPSVEEAESSLLTLADAKGAAVLTDGEYSLPKEENNVIVVHLPATAESDRAKSLAKNDEIIGNVIQEVTSRYPKYTAVYTGSHSEWAEGLEEPEPSYLNRHILAVEVGEGNATVFPGQFVESPNCTLLYAENVTVFIADVNAEGVSTTLVNYTLADTVKATVAGDCEEKYVWQLSYTDTNFTKLEMSMEFEMDVRKDWYLRSFTVDFETTANGAAKKGNNSLNVHGLWAPANFSYHCAGDYFKAKPIQPSSTVASVRFAKLQLQPFNLTGKVFGEPWDCVGFFSIGIWMGIMVTLIMMIGLGIGITALASIHTNDRFDDPKGKPLIINIVE